VEDGEYCVGTVIQPSISRLVEALQQEEFFTSPLSSKRSSKQDFMQSSSTVSSRPVSVAPRVESISEDRISSRNRIRILEAVKRVLEDEIPVIGIMNQITAETVLQDKPSGSWILRQTAEKELRLSVKKGEEVLHMKVYQDGNNGVKLKRTDPAEPLPRLIKRLTEKRKLKEQVTDCQIPPSLSSSSV